MCEYLKHHKIRKCPNSTGLRKEVVLRCEIEGDDFSNKTKEDTIKPADGKIGGIPNSILLQSKKKSSKLNRNWFFETSVFIMAIWVLAPFSSGGVQN